ncbi:MAG: tetratricopeptide repeat protein [Hyphomicrobiales bacterium]|nr:tetratricopeptide repeat protein [Hyphomicrobiales bacterium]MCP5370221.1 tetratricopeptide repeat protein [Hyphomicrobiales bacterium]
MDHVPSDPGNDDAFARLIDERTPRPWHDRYAESTLLRADYAIARFQGRETTRAEIRGWCDQTAPILVRLNTGPGGTGKTRLWMQACTEVREKGDRWRCGFLREGGDLSDAALDDLFANRRLLIVIDYAERRSAEVEALLKRAEDRVKVPAKLRLVLLARNAGDWWDGLLRAKVSGDMLGGEQTESEVLAGFAEAEPDRAAYFDDAVADLAKKVTPTATPPARPDLGRPHFAQALYLHMAALAFLHGETLEHETELLDFVLAREDDMRARQADGQFSAQALAQAMAAVTLAGGADDAGEARDLLRRAPLLADFGNEDLRRVQSILQGLYPGDRFLNPLQPDIIGEHLVARELRHDGGLLPSVLDDAPENLIGNTLTVLTRLAHRDDAQSQWLERALAGRLGTLAEPALDVAVETGDPLGPILAKVLTAEPDPVLAERIMDRVDRDFQQTVSLREVAAVATGQYAAAGSLGDSEDEAAQAESARAKTNLANRLGDLGRREEALTAAGEAVALYRELAAARSDAFRPDLATSLNNLANFLSALGRHEEALTAGEEAVAIRRELAAARPDAFRPDLAASLNNLANHLSELGRREEALTAGEEAVALYRELAAARSDAFRPDLAMSLNNLANRLSDLGRREEALTAAEEAVAIRRELSAARPDAFRPDLAKSLNNLATFLSDLGRREEALTAAEEAVALYRDLASARPDAFRPDLAMSLNNLANFLSGLGRSEEALTAAEEAVALYRDLAAARPDAFRPDLAGSLNNLANFLSALGRREEALAAAEEAVAIRRELSAARPDAFRPDLATSLNNLANFLSTLGRREEALAAAREAVETLSPYFLAIPLAYAQWMMTMGRNYLERCKESNTEPDETLLGPIAEALQSLQAGEGDGGDPDGGDAS